MGSGVAAALVLTQAVAQALPVVLAVLAVSGAVGTLVNTLA